MFKNRKLTALLKLDNNPRTIKGDDFDKLCKSIQDNPDYFQARPLILSDRTGQLVIIAGNQRYEAARHLKIKEVPTYLIAGLTEEREREIIIRDNISLGDFDYDMLANEWDAELLVEWGVNVPVDFGIIEEETHLVIEKKQIFALTIETEDEHNFNGIKDELDRLQITYSERSK